MQVAPAYESLPPFPVALSTSYYSTKFSHPSSDPDPHQRLLRKEKPSLRSEETKHHSFISSWVHLQNPLLSGRNAKQAPYGNQQSPIRGRQGEREREGGRRRPLAPSQKTNYRPEMVPRRKASKRKGKKTETSILGTQKTNGQPKQRRLRRTRSRVRENRQNHSRRSPPPLRF